MEKVADNVADGEKSADKEEGEMSSSTTQSMNMEDFLNSNNNKKLVKECKRKQLDSETNSGSQVKRFKTTTSVYTGNESKSMIVVEGQSGEKGDANLKCGTKYSQETSTSQIKNLTMGGEGEDVSLLHPWIQRWRKNKSAETQEPGGELEVVNTKGTLLQKQFPSIAAMALMGKALSLTPTGRKKTSSVFVWNAQDLR